MALLAGCHRGATTDPLPQPDNLARTVTAGAWDSLPLLPVASGTLVCLSAGPASACPFEAATANWLSDGRFATWQPDRLVDVWTGGNPNPSNIGDVGPAEKQYSTVTAVAATPSGFTVLDVGSFGTRALLFDKKGNYQSNHPIPTIRPTFATGFSGSVPLLQSVHEIPTDSAAVFEVREIDSPGDTIGVSVLKVPLPWLIIRNGRPAHALPLFPTLPSFAIAADSDVVWSPGNIRDVQRVSAHGQVRWTLTSPATGAAIMPADIAALRTRVPGDQPGAMAAFDSSVARTPGNYPAVAALYVAPDNRVLLVGAPAGAGDSVALYVLDRTGAPVGRMALPRQTRPLLFGGDSILVQRVGANAALELRWLRFAKKP